MFLLNSLTRLAVSDVQAIKSDAKQLSLVSRTRLIYEIESTLLQWHTFVQKLPKCTLLCPFINFQKSKIKNVFPYPSYMIHFLPNKEPKIAFERHETNEGEELTVHASQAYEGIKGRDRHMLNIPINRNGRHTSSIMTLAIIGKALPRISNLQ